MKSFIDTKRIPEDAGEYAEALDKMLDRIPDGWGRWISCDKGWYPLITELDAALAEINPDYTLCQVKEKFGGLRYYTGSLLREVGDDEFLTVEVIDEFFQLITAAEAESYKICEICGKPGSMYQVGGYWLKTLCEDDAAERKAVPSKSVEEMSWQGGEEIK